MTDEKSQRRRALAGMPPGNSPALTTKVSLQLPATLPYQDWERVGQQLAGVVSSSSWWLGDWLVFGRKHYEDRYQRGAKVAGLSYQTLRNYASIAGRVPPEQRRPRLSFQHHAEVAALPDDERGRWLSLADEHGWSVKEFRRRIRQAQDDSKDAMREDGGTQRLTVPGDRLQLWHAAAAKVGIAVEDWVLIILDQAAEEALT